MSQKIDIDISKNTDGLFDISFASDGDLATTEGFDTAIKMSIFCERRANKNEIPTAVLRRGWIGNILSDVVGFEIGSKRWLYDQARMTDSTLNGIVNEVQTGLDWLVEDNLLDEVTAEAVESGETIEVEINLYRNNSRVDQQYYDAWRATGL